MARPFVLGTTSAYQAGVFDPVQPLVLLDDVAAGTARLFTDPVEIVIATRSG